MSEAYTEQDLREAQKFFAPLRGYIRNETSMFADLAAEFARVRREAVAGAVKSCANVIPAYSTLGGWLDSPKEVERAIHSLTPADAAAAIERIRAEAERKGRLDEREIAVSLWQQLCTIRGSLLLFDKEISGKRSANTFKAEARRIIQEIRYIEIEHEQRIAALEGKETEHESVRKNS